MSSEQEHPVNGSDWAKAYPEPKDRSTSAPLSQLGVEEIARRTDEGQRPGVDFVIVDVRRTDCTSLIPGAINIPAQSVFVSAPTLAAVLRSVPLVLFHCNRSNGRGPRAAGWYADELQRQTGMADGEIAKRVGIVRGGIAAWEAAFGKGSLDERGAGHGQSTVQL